MVSTTMHFCAHCIPKRRNRRLRPMSRTLDWPARNHRSSSGSQPAAQHVDGPVDFRLSFTDIRDTYRLLASRLPRLTCAHCLVLYCLRPLTDVLMCARPRIPLWLACTDTVHSHRFYASSTKIGGGEKSVPTNIRWSQPPKKLILKDFDFWPITAHSCTSTGTSIPSKTKTRNYWYALPHHCLQ
jgi:hypothetical protein